MSERRFTPAEVNKLIPELEAVIKSLRNLEGEIQEKEWRLKQAKVEARRAGLTAEDAFLKDEAEIDFLRILAQGQFERVRALGGEVKGGYLVDFPGRIEGQDVLLCWKPGEPTVQWFHGLYEGMMGRKPIPEDALEQPELDDGSEGR
ncbi:MAG TPA: DUF2203 domain-containing protein [Symbiobacteriaceae bacterium]|nr:DUF2203 domain-containing protein [Symbiobacteriaceae bacterium]